MRSTAVARLLRLAIVMMLLALGCGGGQAGTTRGVNAQPVIGTDTPKVEVGRQVALLIGVTEYDHEGWTDLTYPLQDVAAVERELRGRYGFDDGDIVRLDNPTGRDIIATLRELKASLRPRDTLLIYVASHGYSVDGIGHIITRDAGAPEEIGMPGGWSFSHAQLMTLIDRLPAERVLVMLDTCHAGDALRLRLGGTRSSGGAKAVEGRSPQELVAEAQRYKVRLMVTSASEGEVKDRSPFAGHFVALLREAGEARGALTHHEVVARLKTQARSSDHSLAAHGTFGDSQTNALFVLVHQDTLEEMAARSEEGKEEDIEAIACGGPKLPCSTRGDDYIYGRGVEHDMKKAARLYERACEKGELPGCAGLGYFARYGWAGVERELRRARELYERSCTEVEASGCGGLGSLYMGGLAGLPRDEEKAFRLARRACDARSLWGCTNLGYMYENGHGVEKDQKRAVALYKKACDGGYMMGCHDLGFMYEHGYGVEQDQKRAVALYQKACDGGDMGGCFNLGFIYEHGHGVEQDQKKAAALYKRACDGGDMGGCFNLGFMYEHGHGVEKDQKGAVALYKRACDDGYMMGCTNLGVMYKNGYGVERGQKKAAALYQKACDGGDMGGCFNLGFMYEHGHGVEKDQKRAAALYKRACDGGDMGGCYNLGVMYTNGSGVEQDQKRAATLYAKACDGDDGSSCNNLAWIRCHDQGQCGDDVLTMARRATDLTPDTGGIWDTLAYILCRRGETAEANAAYEKSCELGYKRNCGKSCDRKD